MIEQLIYRRAEQGYRTVAQSDGLMGKGLARRIEALSVLPPSGGKKRLGAQPVYSRCAVEDGLAMLMTVSDPGGIRGSHLTHAWYVQPQDVAAFFKSAGLAPAAYVSEYHEQSRMDALPALEVGQLPAQDVFSLGCQAAQALFGQDEKLLAQFLRVVARCGVPTSSRGFLGACVLSALDEDALTLHAYHLMEAALRGYPADQVRAVGYRSLWVKAEDNVRYPVFFTTPDLLGSESSVPMNYILFDLRSGSVRLPRNAPIPPEDHDLALARALLSGDAERIPAMAQEIEARVAREKARQEALRRAEEEARLRREAEEKARQEAEARVKAEAEARRLRELEEQARLRKEAQERERKEAQERLRRESEARAQAEAERVRLKREEDERIRRENEEKAQREIEERKRRAEAQAQLYREQKARAEEQARKQAEEQARKQAEEKARKQREAEDQARSRKEPDRIGQAASRERAAAKTLSEQRQAAPTQAAEGRSDTEILNGFLSALHVHSAEIPAVELHALVENRVREVVRGNGDTDWAYLNYAALLLQATAATLRDRRDELKSSVYVLLARCAYAIADCVMDRMFLNPTDRRTRACMDALSAIDRQVEKKDSPAHRYVSPQRRDKWFIYISILEGRAERRTMENCLNALCYIRDNNLNGMLEQLQRTLETQAVAMIRACAGKPARSNDRSALFARATLAAFYATLRFDARNRPSWAPFGRNLVGALREIKQYEIFNDEFDNLIDILRS